MKSRYPTQAELKHRFVYDSEAGLLRYAFPAGGMQLGDTAGSAQCKRREWQIRVNGPRLSAARLIWIWHNGDIPEDCVVKFRDGDRLNLRIENMYLHRPLYRQRQIQGQTPPQGFGFTDDRTGAGFAGFRTDAQAREAQAILEKYYLPNPDYERLA